MGREAGERAYQMVGTLSELIRLLSTVMSFAPVSIVVAAMILSAGSLLISRPKLIESLAIAEEMGYTIIILY